MSRADGPPETLEVEAASGRAGLRLLAAALVCLVAAGALLWWQHGSAVFASIVSGALAWCL